MPVLKKRFLLVLIPLFILIWGMANIFLPDPFYSRAIDPDYPYLINGLNVSLLNFNRIGHTDHPGTPFQVFNGIIIRITHFLAGKDSVAQDVIGRSDFYLSAINFSLLGLLTLFTFLIGVIGERRKIAWGNILILQGGILLNDVVLWMFNRAVPEYWFLIVSQLFLLIYLYHGYNQGNLKKFAIWSGVVMAMGLATKINYFPLLLLPLLLFRKGKQALWYSGSVFVSYFIFIAPIIDKFRQYIRFLFFLKDKGDISSQDDARFFQMDVIKKYILELYNTTPEFCILIIVLITSFILSVLFWKKKGMLHYLVFISGLLLISAALFLLTSLRFRVAYLLPLFSMYGLIFFKLNLFFSELINNKWLKPIPILVVIALFSVLSFGRVAKQAPIIKNEMKQREEIRQFVQNNIPPRSFWFVEPTWESAPYVENGLIYGFVYCRHKEDYLPELMKFNPNIVTYEKRPDYVKIWMCRTVPLDSVVASGQIVHLYSSPGRQCGILLDMIREAAGRSQVEIAIDTLFRQEKTQSFIISARATNRCSDWMPERVIHFTREGRIQELEQSILHNKEWLSDLENKAKEQNIPLDSLVRSNAVWMVDHP